VTRGNARGCALNGRLGPHRRELAFLCAREYVGDDWLRPRLRQEFGGVSIASKRFHGEAARQVLERGEADAAAFGVLLIANPDLPHRLAIAAPLHEPDPRTCSASGPVGNTDDPTLDESGHAAA
jgi:2,4-dienoyl-CoA reductase-like NADH-dependent reductase (Old Yellow Enzyme family)